MRKILPLLAVPLLACAFSVSVALAQDPTPPQQVTLTVNTPKANTTVNTIFTLSGTLDQACPIEPSIGLEDNIDSNSFNYGEPYLPQASHYYTVAATDTGGPTTFSFQVDLSKAYWVRGQGDLVQKTPQPGKLRVYVNTSYDPSCYGYAEVIVNLAAQPAVAASAPKPNVPRRVAEQISPSPTPSATVRPIVEQPAEAKSSKWHGLDPWVWIAIALAVGGLVVGLAEYTAIRYHRTHPKIKKK